MNLYKRIKSHDVEEGWTVCIRSRISTATYEGIVELISGDRFAVKNIDDNVAWFRVGDIDIDISFAPVDKHLTDAQLL